MTRWLLLALAACGSSAAPADNADKTDTAKPERPKPPPKPGVPGIALPVVAATGYAPADPDARPRVVVSPSAITVEGAPVIGLRGGVIGDDEIRAIAKWLGEFATKTYATGPKPPLVLAIDRGITYRALTRLLRAAQAPRAGGWTQASLLALHDDKLVAVPVALHDDAPRAAPPGAPTSRSLTFVNGKFSADPLMADTVLAQIRGTYAGGIDRCYTEELARHPHVHGTLQLDFTVGESGALTAAAATGVTGVDACVTALMRAWEFPAPLSSGKPTTVAFRFALYLSEDPTGRVRALPDAGTPLDMTVSVYRNETRVWSASGFEGTEHEPLATTSTGRGVDKLAPALAAVVDRHWKGVPRPADTKSIVIRADGDVTLADIAPVLGAVRADKGVELFPDVRLSAGLE